MLNRLFLASTRIQRVLIAAGLAAFVGAPAADAALKKYEVRNRQLLHYTQTSPIAEYRTTTVGGTGVIDDSGADPVLVKLVFKSQGGATTIVPGLSGGFIHFRSANFRGPSTSGGHSGTGSTASTINWGNVDGYTTSGGTWCNAIPSFICELANVVLLETVTSQNISTNYDYGTWVFHGTGFGHVDTAGFVFRTGPTAAGNIQVTILGKQVNDGTVPALPLLGIGTVGLSLVSLAAAAVRRNRKS